MKIGIIAPSYGVSERQIDAAREFLTKAGFTAVPFIAPSQISDSKNQQERLKNTQEKREVARVTWQAFTSDMDVLWAIRGGCGASGVLQHMHEMARLGARVPPKTLVGYSDITALHCWCDAHFPHVRRVHGSMLREIIDGEVSVEAAGATIRMVKGEKLPAIEVMPINNGVQYMDKSLLDLPIIGGNLAVLQSSIGTFWQVDFRDKILLIEDVDEAENRLERMINHLQQAGILDDISALILGCFTYKGSDGKRRQVSNQCLISLAENVNKPVFTTTNIGHIESNHPVELGVAQSRRFVVHNSG